MHVNYCVGQYVPEEMEEIYRWLYDNVTLFGDEEKQDLAVLITPARTSRSYTSCRS